jgi:hypothetical protein
MKILIKICTDCCSTNKILEGCTFYIIINFTGCTSITSRIGIVIAVEIVVINSIFIS